MSTLWTPDGERPIRRAEPSGAAPPGAGGTETAGGPAGSPASGPGPADPGGDEADDEAAQAEMERLQRELAEAPVEMVIANHAVGLFNLAGLHLSQQPPHLDQARLAIDALSALVDGLAGRLGADEAPLRDGLAQLRLAFVQISSTHQGDPTTP
jgi:hypothetical protein